LGKEQKMTYYTDEKFTFFINGTAVSMTEEEVEDYQEAHPEADIIAGSEVPASLPDEAADDYLDCRCQPDPPNGTAPLCPACVLFFESLQD
jgi:hypothetical protein